MHVRNMPNKRKAIAEPDKFLGCGIPSDIPAQGPSHPWDGRYAGPAHHRSEFLQGYCLSFTANYKRIRRSPPAKKWGRSYFL